VIRDDWLPDVASAAVADTPVFTSAEDAGDDVARGAADSPENNIAEIGGNPRRFGNLISGIRRTSTITAASVSVCVCVCVCLSLSLSLSFCVSVVSTQSVFWIDRQESKQ
jgi:hypothetical protein